MATAHILILESDTKISRQLSGTLQKQGFNVTQCQDVSEGLMVMPADYFDLILVNAFLPTNDDLSPLQAIRSWGQTPVIVLSSINTTAKRIESFRQGADDFISKPIDSTEIVLRVNAILRRTHKGESNIEGEIDIDHLRLLKSRQQVFYRGDNLAFTPIQFRLLWILAENRFKVVSKQFLYRAVLNRQFSRYDRSLEMHLSRIRKKFIEVGISADRFATIHGKGYRFS